MKYLFAFMILVICLGCEPLVQSYNFATGQVSYSTVEQEYRMYCQEYGIAYVPLNK